MLKKIITKVVDLRVYVYAGETTANIEKALIDIENDLSKIQDKVNNLCLSDVRLSLFNEVYNKFVECEDDNEFTQYLNENTNKA